MPPPAPALPVSVPGPGLEALLRDLGSRITRGSAPAPAAPCVATGLAAIDHALGGGFPRGRVSEVVGPACSGRTSLALALLARVTAQGELAAVVDRPDVFDAASAAGAGVDLARVLWVRPPGLGEALRSVEHVLRAGGFPLVLLDLSGEAPTQRIPTAAWPRLRKATAASAAALVLLAQRRLAGSFADLALELDAARPRFERGPDWLAGLDSRVRLVRSRAGPAPAEVAVRWPASGCHAA